jgi:hypothetical protein
MEATIRKVGEWTGKDGGVSIELPALRVVLVTMRGRVDEGTARHFAQALTGLLKVAPPKNTFWDLYEMESYHPSVRTLLTQALLDNWDNVAGVQVIARSRIVKMGVAVANVALHGRVQSFDKPEIFENAIVAACRG